MQVALGIVSAGLLGLIVYFAVSSKSSKLVKRVALAALALVVLSLGVCGILLIRGPGQKTTDIPLPLFQDAPAPAKSSNIAAILIFSVVFLLVLSLIIFIAFRRQGKQDTAAAKQERTPSVFSDDDDLNIKEPAIEELEDSFEIDIK